MPFSGVERGLLGLLSVFSRVAPRVVAPVRSPRRAVGGAATPSSRVPSSVRRARARPRPRRLSGACLGPRARANGCGAGVRCGRLGLARRLDCRCVCVRARRSYAAGGVGARRPRPGAGPTGPRRANGLLGLQYVSTSEALPAGGIESVAVLCPPGKRVISGGGYTNVGILFGSHAVSPEGWEVSADNPTALDGSIEVSALCAQLTDGAMAAPQAPATPRRARSRA